MKEKEKILQEALKDPKMLEKLGAAMAAPIIAGLSRRNPFSGVSVTSTPMLTEEDRIANKPW